jgi:hypothetical protein
MEVMLIMAVVGAIVGAIGGAIAEGDHEKARALRQEAVDEYGPDILPVLDRLTAQEVGESEFAKIVEDPALRGAQTDVMDELRNVYESEGMTDADRAALQVAQNEVSQRAASDRASLQQRLARTGQTGNAALEAAAGATISGDAVGATADMTLRAQMAARQRALQALTARGGLAGDVRGADLAFGSARASGQDRINLFNASQRADAANQNNANALNMFGAELGIRDARNRARGALADEFTRKGQRTSQSAAGFGKSLTSAGSAYAQGGK